MAVKITHIAGGSIAKNHHIKAGDSLLTINGGEINDMLDLQFYSTNKELVLEMEGEDGKKRTIKLTKEDEYEPLGFDFETYLIDKHHFCKNKCAFCFIDQLPKGMRESLYF
ncbi:MAG: radical SAM protein, partial [Oscillospiraceae bacterium]